MRSILNTIRRLLGAVASGDGQTAEEAYLAGAEDLHDLEYRIRELDRRRAQTKPFSHLRHP